MKGSTGTAVHSRSHKLCRNVYQHLSVAKPASSELFPRSAKATQLCCCRLPLHLAEKANLNSGSDALAHLPGL